MDRLAGIDAKLDRAEQQIGALRPCLRAWSTREKPYGLRPEIDKAKRRYIEREARDRWQLDVYLRLFA
jgi:hypothetical protein